MPPFLCPSVSLPFVLCPSSIYAVTKFLRLVVFSSFLSPSPILFRPLSLSLSNSPSLRIPWDERSVYAEGERGNRTDYRGYQIL